ncbi:MAG: hypothetical protein A2W19_04200 [Spirochaetes bacterium RBG_16_49_21]|nr:MAG: hypothetical protein A2W19_04200 [Spirochaetes bacterium RBG_16_49_21]
MKISEAIQILNAEVHNAEKEQLDAEIKTARASDLMSEILASTEVPDMLLTGLTNAQVIRLASIFGIKAITIVRGKEVDPKIFLLAKEEKIVIMTTKYSLFTSCGKLYEKGINGEIINAPKPR